MENAYEMAVEALGLCISDIENEKGALPAPSSPDIVKTEENAFIAVIEFDKLAYKKRHGTKSVKKTLTIPEWLNEEALANNINFSQVLQDALINKLMV